MSTIDAYFLSQAVNIYLVKLNNMAGVFGKLSVIQRPINRWQFPSSIKQPSSFLTFYVSRLTWLNKNNKYDDVRRVHKQFIAIIDE